MFSPHIVQRKQYPLPPVSIVYGFTSGTARGMMVSRTTMLVPTETSQQPWCKITFSTGICCYQRMNLNDFADLHEFYSSSTVRLTLNITWTVIKSS